MTDSLYSNWSSWDFVRLYCIRLYIGGKDAVLLGNYTTARKHNLGSRARFQLRICLMFLGYLSRVIMELSRHKASAELKLVEHLATKAIVLDGGNYRLTASCELTTVLSSTVS